MGKKKDDDAIGEVAADFFGDEESAEWVDPTPEGAQGRAGRGPLAQAGTGTPTPRADATAKPKTMRFAALDFAVRDAPSTPGAAPVGAERPRAGAPADEAAWADDAPTEVFTNPVDEDGEPALAVLSRPPEPVRALHMPAPSRPRPTPADDDDDRPTVVVAEDHDLFGSFDLAETPAPPDGPLPAARVVADPPGAEPPSGSPVAPPVAPDWSDPAFRRAALVEGLLAEVDRAPDDGKGALLLEVGSLVLQVLRDPEKAYGILVRAAEAGLPGPVATRALADCAAAKGAVEDQLAHLESLAGQVEGEARTDVVLEIADLCEDGGRVDLLERLGRAGILSVPGAPAFPLLALLRDHLPAEDPRRIKVLGAMATLASGHLAAVFSVEQGVRLVANHRSDEARAAFEAAIASHPANTEAFLALEDIYPREGDFGALAELYVREAEREGSTDQGWWKLQAAYAHHIAGSARKAAVAFRDAVDAGYRFAATEYLGAMLALGDHAEMAKALGRDAVGMGTSEGAAEAWFWLGWIRERHLGEDDGALHAYRAALAVDPDAIPAIDGVLRILRKGGQPAQLAALMDAGELPAAPLLLLRRAEVAEVAGRPREARAALERLLAPPSPSGAGPGAPRPGAPAPADGLLVSSASSALRRVLHRCEDWQAVAALVEVEAADATDPERRAALLYEAFGSGRTGLPRERAQALLEAVLDAAPHHEGALLALELLAAEGSRWEPIARRHVEAARHDADARRALQHMYRAAVILADRTDQPDRAVETARWCLGQDPAFAPAGSLIHELLPAARAAQHALLYAQQAGSSDAGSLWMRYAAAVLGPPSDADARLMELAGVFPDHEAVQRAMLVFAFARGDGERLARLYSGARSRGRTSLRVAQLYLEHGHTEAALEVLRTVADRRSPSLPQRAASRLAERAGFLREAVALLEGLPAREDVIRRARLLEATGEIRDAAATLAQLLRQGDQEPSAAIAAADAARRAGDDAAMCLAYTSLGESAQAPQVAATYWARAARAHARAGHLPEAAAGWRRVLAMVPESDRAFRRCTDVLVAMRDEKSLRSVYGTYRPDQLLGLARRLGEVEGGGPPDPAEGGARDVVYRSAADRAEGAARLTARVEVALVAADRGDWGTALTRIGEALALVDGAAVAVGPDPTGGALRSTLTGWREWVLAERLPVSDAAWESALQARQASPDDRSAVQLLARMAEARGDRASAIELLGELVASAPGSTEARDLLLRAATLHREGGDADAAAAALWEAHRADPEDERVLRLLREVSEARGDWGQVAEVLALQASRERHGRRMELLRERALLLEGELGDPEAALACWSSISERQPDDRESLQRSLDLAERLGRWQEAIAAGRALAALLPAPERSPLTARLGRLAAERATGAEAIALLEEAIAGDHPDPVAAQRLEGVYRERGEWEGVVRTLEIQAAGAADPAAKAEVLLRRAHLERDVRRDRDAAAHAFLQLLELEPDHVEAMRYVTRYLVDAGRHVDAVPIFDRLAPVVEQGVDRDDFDERVELTGFYLDHARALAEAGRSLDAVAPLEQALALNPAHLPALEAIAPLYVVSRQWDRARAVLRQLLPLLGGQADQTRLADAYANLGLAELHLDHVDEAWKRFGRALDLVPNHLDALKGNAMVLEHRGDWTNLLNTYNLVIHHARDAGDVVNAYLAKAKVLDRHLGRPDKAAQHYQRSLDFAPEQLAARMYLAELALRDGDHELAAALVDEALAQPGVAAATPRTVGLLHLEGVVAALLAGRGDDAAAHLEGARAADESLVALLPEESLADVDTLRQLVEVQARHL